MSGKSLERWRMIFAEVPGKVEPVYGMPRAEMEELSKRMLERWRAGMNLATRVQCKVRDQWPREAASVAYKGISGSAGEKTGPES